ncbi:hypothetical protein Tco_0542405 [Tanacetum coccineum]
METQKPLLKDENVYACTRYQVNPKVSHLHAVKRIFRYLKGQPKLGLWYPKDSPFDLVAYTDNDYAGASLDRKSTTGGCQFLGCRLISWQCKKQTVVANSTIKAEYVADSSCCGQLYLILLGKVKKSVKLMMEELFRMELELMLAKTINGEVQLHALVNGKKIIITESTVRRDLQLEDAEGVDCLPNSTIFEQLTLMSLKTTAWNEFSSTMASVPQPSDPSENVTDEAVHKELGDSFVRAATNASSLEAEQDSGNITKSRSKATHNESSSLGTTSGGGPRCQETMRDTIAQTSFKNISKLSNDSLLTRGNTVQSDEDRLKLNELMELCTNLQKRVLDLEKTKTSQHNEIISLKRRVKKLEKKNRSRNHKLTRLYKVGLTDRVESFGDEESLGEDASKQGRINAIDADEDITLINVQDDADKEMFDVDALHGEEVFVVGQNENVVEEVVDAAHVGTAATTDDIQAKIDADYQLAERMQSQEQEELSIKEKATLFQQLLEKRRKHFAAKRAEEKRNKPPTKAQQKNIMCIYIKNMEGYKLNKFASILRSRSEELWYKFRYEIGISSAN